MTHRRRLVLYIGLVLAVLLGSGATGMAAPAPRVANVATTPVPHCAASSRPDTGLDGQVPVSDRVSGRAAEGYSCNLALIGGAPSSASVNFDTYGNCAYFADNPGESGLADGTVVVADVSDPRHPQITDHLKAGAFANPGESLRVNARRGLLVGDHYDTLQLSPNQLNYIHDLAVYDVSRDCRHPELLADVMMPHAAGHEGCFQPDGNVYYMSSVISEGFTPIDLTDPRHPRELSAPWARPYPHGCSISDDGRTGYFSNTINGGVDILDTSSAQALQPNALYRAVGHIPTPDDLTQQSSIPVTYHGHRYLFLWAESANVEHPEQACTDPAFSSLWGYAQLVDVGNPGKPSVASRIQTGVDNPANCLREAADREPQKSGLSKGDPFWSVIGSILLYDFHQCSVDRLHDPTIVACANFASGLRVFDIRDPQHPRELAYYNMGTLSPVDPTIDDAGARPVIRRDLGQIWWVTVYGGLHVAQFTPGVWPFAGDRACVDPTDYYARQYDLNDPTCPTSALAAAGGAHANAASIVKAPPSSPSPAAQTASAGSTPLPVTGATTPMFAALAALALALALRVATWRLGVGRRISRLPP